MIKLIKTISKNGVTTNYPVVAKNKEQADELLRDKRFSLHVEIKEEPKVEIKTDYKKEYKK